MVQGLSQWFKVFHSGSRSFTVVQGLSQWFKVFHSGSTGSPRFKGAQDHSESTNTVVKHTHCVLMMCTLHLRLGLFNLGNTMAISRKKNHLQITNPLTLFSYSFESQLY